MKYALMNLLADAAATTATTDAAAATETMSTGATIIYYAVQFDNLKVGDRICTIGGIYGTIVRIKDDVLTIEVGEQKTQMVFARWAVRNVEQLSVTNDSEQLI